jgi:hypothetical protein
MWDLILLKDLQIVQFIESVNASFQLDWNGVLKCLRVRTYKYHCLDISKKKKN